MHKFFISEDKIFSDLAVIEGEDVKHIYKVLRLKEGEKVNINNCNGREFLGIIDYIDKTKVEVKLLEELEVNNEPPIEVYLFQGLPKSTKMDLITQKCTELGVKEITPIVTSRVSSSINDIKRESKKLDRWNRISFEACKQNKRTLIPVVNDITDFDGLTDKLKDMDLIVVPYENAENYGIKQMTKGLKGEVKKIAIVIGPEGGFEEEEITSLKKMGSHIVTLGPRILRTETAGFTCLALLMYELGDLGGSV
ncbi:16S rRNA (uracil(1498)-N(3))-methyltransferase [Clostridium botulinum]|uniref:Ribosomal RNA small subunit methyltransferase E n=1 Tax=Clostridium botulinum C/D str. DC5 TaxID=1443128 RepID=A0A0A0IEP4_CLOBO|nr:RsmE family RNA methyltransferase [Clostridium botulinum]KEI00970.1 16S rRNA methyltransferase [Clostridium botulinum C/D str. BKT75002]KEI11136.1 16S rRNA methyltransferase [Clostridium botulinum C/D str. BKT2873]KGM94052.1 16S rRNA methyltransferase [Clostridium botulinum D str. CCUG 7971]KGM98998.1 16S rRNA methyltransferase [Clostridium botulinum C/D str. DC5]KOC47406.1 16S rRNA methyltransferase [Clostridium botulinum]